MLLISALVVLALYVSLVFGVRFEGSCPVNLAPNFEVDSLASLLDLERTIVVSIPHSQPQGSYFFQRINYFANKHVIYLQHEIELRHPWNNLLVFTMYTIPQLLVQATIIKNGSELFFNTSVKYVTVLPSLSCFKPIVEKVNMWLEGSTFIIWSCREVGTGYSDGAIIVVDLNLSGGIREILQEINNATEMYLPSSILDEIGFNSGLLTVDTPDLELSFKCPGTSFTTTIIIFLIYVIIIISVLILMRTLLRNTQVNNV